MQQTTKKRESMQVQILKTEPGMMPILKIGDLVEAALVERNSKGVFFEIPKVGTGIVYGRELMSARDILKKLQKGDVVTAKIADSENESGFIELSLAEAGQQKTWQSIKELKEKDEPIKVKVVNANSGGLITEVGGVQAFLPASQLSNEHYPAGAENDRNKLIEELQKFIGEELTVKIINLNPRTNKLIVSEREVLSQDIKELIAKYNVGDIIDGIISGVANFGAFIKFADNPEVEGLIHISELDHRLIENPKEVVEIGNMIKAKITEIKDNKISLSLKALQADPWEKIKDIFQEGQIINGRVHKFNPFGALIKLNEDIMGLIHVSEFGSVEEMKKILEESKSYKFSIDSIKPEDKRVILKLAKES
ncbi:MAG TPA: S1 RNA-binding domain-containing protein [Candidatus Paceibacterota bacterium]